MYLVIFDCDGTLVDSQVMIVDAMSDAFETFGLQPPSPQETLSIVGLSLEPAISKLTAHLPNVPVPELAEEYKNAFNRRRQKDKALEPFYEGIRGVLDRLSEKDDVLLGIATGKARRGVDRVLKGHEMEGRFATIQTADMAPSKPHPGMILQALQETGADASRTVMIGDTSYDMGMARSAGVFGLGVSWGYHSIDLMKDAGAHTIIDHAGEIEPALASLLNWA